MADDQTDATSHQEDAKGLRKQLEEALAKANAAEARAAAAEQKAQRDAAFAKAGLPESKLADMFRDSYQGDMTPDAIRAQAVEVGLMQAQTTTPQAERQQILAAQQDPFSPNRADPTQGNYADVLEQITAPNVRHDSDAIQKILIDKGMI